MTPQAIADDQPRWVRIIYTNYKGERRTYTIIPHQVTFGNNEWHTTEQWLLSATDIDRNVVRQFAMKDISTWEVFKP